MQSTGNLKLRILYIKTPWKEIESAFLTLNWNKDSYDVYKIKSFVLPFIIPQDAAFSSKVTSKTIKSELIHKKFKVIFNHVRAQ